jgi:hypothetical protein
VELLFWSIGGANVWSCWCISLCGHCIQLANSCRCCVGHVQLHSIVGTKRSTARMSVSAVAIQWASVWLQARYAVRITTHMVVFSQCTAHYAVHASTAPFQVLSFTIMNKTKRWLQLLRNEAVTGGFLNARYRLLGEPLLVLPPASDVT